MSVKETILTAVDRDREKTIALAKWLFEHPEIALEEKESCKAVAQYMQNAGFNVEMNVANVPHSFKATKKQGNSGARIAILAEYDALPGLGHACGHHLIAAMSAAAGAALAEALHTYPGEVTVFGTPAEETGDGKASMTDAGVFDGYDAALEIHPNNTTVIYPPFIGIGGNDYTFHGRTSHAGVSPFQGVNACDAVVLFFTAIGLLRQQLVDGTRVHGIIQEAGTAANAIPGLSRARVEFRSDDTAYFNRLVERINQCAEGAALATGCTVEYHPFEPTCYNLDHSTVIGNRILAHFKELGVDNIALDSKDRGSSDIGNVSQVIPCIQPMLCVTEACSSTIHTAEFRDRTLLPFAQDRAILGAKALALTGLDLLSDPELVKRARKELDDRRNGK